MVLTFFDALNGFNNDDASDNEDDWEAINQPPTFMDNIAAIDPVIPRTSVYFADHVHFTDKGAELVARSIFKEILR